MPASRDSLKKRVSIATALALACFLYGCGSSTKNSSSKRTYPMGEKVQVGSLVYTVLEADWKTQLTDAVGSKAPAHRYLFLNVSINNTGASEVAVPLLEIQNTAGQGTPEVSEGIDEVGEWMGLLRIIQPNQTLQGLMIFDVPVGAYKLKLTDGGDIESEKIALVEIPVSINSD